MKLVILSECINCLVIDNILNVDYKWLVIGGNIIDINYKILIGMIFVMEKCNFLLKRKYLNEFILVYVKFMYKKYIKMIIINLVFLI